MGAGWGKGDKEGASKEQRAKSKEQRAKSDMRAKSKEQRAKSDMRAKAISAPEQDHPFNKSPSRSPYPMTSLPPARMRGGGWEGADLCSRGLPGVDRHGDGVGDDEQGGEEIEGRRVDDGQRPAAHIACTHAPPAARQCPVSEGAGLGVEGWGFTVQGRGRPRAGSLCVILRYAVLHSIVVGSMQRHGRLAHTHPWDGARTHLPIGARARAHIPAEAAGALCNGVEGCCLDHVLPRAGGRNAVCGMRHRCGEGCGGRGRSLVVVPGGKGA